MQTRRQAEFFWSGLLLFLSAIGLLWLIPDYIHMPQKLQNPYLSPRLWPTIIFYSFGALGLCMFIKVLLALYKEKNTGPSAVQDGVSRREMTRQSLSVLTALSCMGFSLVLIEPLGMPLSVTLCLVALLCLSGKKSSPMGVVCLLALPLCLYLFFLYVADVSIPLGILG
ncbi:MAG: tripartite tricarboxylate transporter TctB family protein [Desulfovibrionaceae bacterium]